MRNFCAHFAFLSTMELVMATVRVGPVPFRFHPVSVPNGSLAVHEAVPAVPIPGSGGSDHRFHSYFSFNFNIKIL